MKRRLVLYNERNNVEIKGFYFITLFRKAVSELVWRELGKLGF
jgi:hypothetical protein